MSCEKMIRPVFMITSIFIFLNCVDTGKLRVQIDKNFNSTYIIGPQQVTRHAT